ALRWIGRRPRRPIPTPSGGWWKSTIWSCCRCRRTERVPPASCVANPGSFDLRPGVVGVDERPILLAGIAAQGRFDDAVRRADHGRQLGAGVDVQLLVDVDEVGGDRPLADVEAFGNFAVGETVHDVTDDLALAIAELLI